MNELANNVNGERVAFHPETAELKVMVQFPGRPGGPRNVVGPNRLPLYVAVDTTADELRGLVNDETGRYRFVQVDRNRRPIEAAEPLYLDVLEPTASRRDGEPDERDYVRELVRANSHMVQTIAERFAAMMESAAHLLRAADGAGLPAREPSPPVTTPVAAPMAVEPDVTEAPGVAQVIAETLAKATPLINHLVLTKVAGLTPEQAIAAAGGPTAMQNVTPAPAAPAPAAPAPAPVASPAPPAAPAPPAPVDPILHMNAIEALLAPREKLVIVELIRAMSPEQIAAWRGRLCTMSAQDAATAIRGEIADLDARRKAGGAS